MTIGLLVQKISEGFLPYMGMAAILVMWLGPREQTFVPPIPWMLHMKFYFNWPSGFRVEDVWKCWQMTDYRWQTMTTEASHTISSPVSLWLRRAKSYCWEGGIKIKLLMVFSEKTDVPHAWIFSFSPALTLKIRSRSPNLTSCSLLCPNYIAKNSTTGSQDNEQKRRKSHADAKGTAPKSVCPPPSPHTPHPRRLVDIKYEEAWADQLKSFSNKNTCKNEIFQQLWRLGTY